MSELQQAFTRALEGKKRIIGPSKNTVERWKNGKTSPTLHTVETICKSNDLEVPFFFDGNIQSLHELNKRIGKKMGFKIIITFE